MIFRGRACISLRTGEATVPLFPPFHFVAETCRGSGGRLELLTLKPIISCGCGVNARHLRRSNAHLFAGRSYFWLITERHHRTTSYWVWGSGRCLLLWVQDKPPLFYLLVLFLQGRCRWRSGGGRTRWRGLVLPRKARMTWMPFGKTPSMSND